MKPACTMMVVLGLVSTVGCDQRGDDADPVDQLLREADAALDQALQGDIPFESNGAWGDCADAYSGCIAGTDPMSCVPAPQTCGVDLGAIDDLTQCYLTAQTDAEFDACADLELDLLDGVDACVDGAVGDAEDCVDGVEDALGACDDELDGCLGDALDTMCADFVQQCVDLGGGAACDAICEV